MKVAITGHRPENILDEKWTREAIQESLKIMEASLVIQGMAAGVDLWSAAAAWKLNLPYIAARPWATHTAGKANTVAYEWVLKNAVEVVNISDATSYPGPQIYKTRNIYMVDKGDVVLAVWNGLTYGGTYHAVQYAIQADKKIFRINPATKEIDGWVN